MPSPASLLRRPGGIEPPDEFLASRIAVRRAMVLASLPADADGARDAVRRLCRWYWSRMNAGLRQETLPLFAWIAMDDAVVLLRWSSQHALSQAAAATLDGTMLAEPLAAALSSLDGVSAVSLIGRWLETDLRQHLGARQKLERRLWKALEGALSAVTDDAVSRRIIEAMRDSRNCMQALKAARWGLSFDDGFLPNGRVPSVLLEKYVRQRDCAAIEALLGDGTGRAIRRSLVRSLHEMGCEGSTAASIAASIIDCRDAAAGSGATSFGTEAMAA